MMMHSRVGVKSFYVFVLWCAACSESPTDNSDAGARDELPADVQVQLDHLPADMQTLLLD